MIQVVLVGDGSRETGDDTQSQWVTDVDEHDDVEMLTLAGLELSMLRVLLAMEGRQATAEPQDTRSLRFCCFSSCCCRFSARTRTLSAYAPLSVCACV